ncbi:hypothetical protein HHL16_12375 [Pseudoflavitalea sp. G-6-1-2]|uniref:hypothetical protein n=1 Tax=Pseudoflavitalea sp. G-6-1-2 TaxID=2728841 RepID=UPI00146F119A|nr:hypothetical protein [Pseudoflavitalea sp. G-6-1-2]NML21678.1 hypothetical protein [Pseudoflavitalea sp. G-6-1-2]
MFRYSFCFLCSWLLLAACKKESALQPSGIEETILTVKDNPNDPVDHAIYQFFQRTGIPCYYNDTLAKKEIGVFNGVPRYYYTRLTLAYSGAAGRDTAYKYNITSDKSKVLPMLQLLEHDLMPRIPSSVKLFSVLFVEDLAVRKNYIPTYPELTALNSYGGFNTMAMRIVNPDTFSVESKKKYLAEALGTACYKRLTTLTDIDLNDFYSISRKAFGDEIYNTEFTSWFPDQNRKPEEFGLILYYPVFEIFILTPMPEDDLRSFLDAVFLYSTAEFNALYQQYPLVIKKFKLLKDFAKQIGFQFPD